MNEEKIFEPKGEMPQYEYSAIDAEVKISADKIASLLSRMKNANTDEWRELQKSLFVELEFATNNLFPLFDERKGINDELLRQQVMEGYRTIAQDAIDGIDTVMRESKWNQNDIDMARADMEKIEIKIIPDLIGVGLKEEAHMLNAKKEMVDLKISNDS